MQDIFNLGKWDIFGGFVTWEQISQALMTAAPGKSQINPFDCAKLPDFNIWYYLIGIFAMFYTRGAWQGSMGYAAAAKNPHEGKMASILGTWRGTAQGLMIMLFPLAVIAIMKNPEFADLSGAITDTLNNTVDSQLRKQGLVPTALSLIMPTGLLGLFVAVMFAAMLSTDDTYMHSWGSIFIQDVVMPFRKKPLSAKQHILMLRFSIIFVACFAWLFSYFFRQTEYVYMFFAITGAIVSGAGAAIIGGLYWKKGGTIAAWVTYIWGALIAITGIVLQQTWRYKDGSGLARVLSETFEWEWVAQNQERFPINGQWITFIGMCSCITLYILISLFEGSVLKRPDFNLMKMLHRGAYDSAKEHIVRTKTGIWAQRLGITNEFSVGDKILYAVTIGWTLLWTGIFFWFTTQYFFFGKTENGVWTAGVSSVQWLELWHIKLFVILFLSVATTIWFLIGGIVDVIKLFRALKQVRRNDQDDGSVIDGTNAGDPGKSSSSKPMSE